MTARAELTKSNLWRQSLRRATYAAHRRLDARFASFDLSSPAGFGLFLQAHYLAVKAYQPIVAKFIEAELGMEFPDYRELLEADLAEWDLTPPDVSLPAPDRDVSEAGLAYTILGSRLGAAMLLRQHGPALRDTQPAASLAFLSENKGVELWKALLHWSRHRDTGGEALEADIAGAEAGFALFFAAADAVQPPANAADEAD